MIQCSKCGGWKHADDIHDFEDDICEDCWEEYGPQIDAENEMFRELCDN